jgi:predicted nuclease with TOPRIM domain
MSSYESTDAFLSRKFKESSVPGKNVMYTNMRLTAEIEELKNRIKQLETDMAYNNQLRASSPEEQRIYDLRRTD